MLIIVSTPSLIEPSCSQSSMMLSGIASTGNSLPADVRLVCADPLLVDPAPQGVSPITVPSFQSMNFEINVSTTFPSPGPRRSPEFRGRPRVRTMADIPPETEDERRERERFERELKERERRDGRGRDSRPGLLLQISFCSSFFMNAQVGALPLSHSLLQVCLALGSSGRSTSRH